MDANQIEMMVRVGDLDELGISSKVVVEFYKVSAGRMLNLNELIKVSQKDEGKNINFETMDRISIIVPVFSADGSWNKIE